MSRSRAIRLAKTDAVASRRRKLIVCLATFPSLLTDLVLRGMCRDRNVLGCGRPRCRVCHSDKVDDKPSFRDRRLLSERESD